jgi:hypothetical protein
MVFIYMHITIPDEMQETEKRKNDDYNAVLLCVKEA